MSQTTEHLSYFVPGLSCDHCRTAVTAEVEKVGGVSSVEVDLDAKRVRVTGADLRMRTFVPPSTRPDTTSPRRAAVDTIRDSLVFVGLNIVLRRQRRRIAVIAAMLDAGRGGRHRPQRVGRRSRGRRDGDVPGRRRDGGHRGRWSRWLSDSRWRADRTGSHSSQRLPNSPRRALQRVFAPVPGRECCRSSGCEFKRPADAARTGPRAARARTSNSTTPKGPEHRRMTRRSGWRWSRRWSCSLLGIASRGDGRQLIHQRVGKQTDAAFITDMTAHHEARHRHGRARHAEGRPRQIRTLADDIISAQKGEIATMKATFGQRHALHGHATTGGGHGHEPARDGHGHGHGDAGERQAVRQGAPSTRWCPTAEARCSRWPKAELAEGSCGPRRATWPRRS